MSRIAEYCNITTDLQSVCKELETYAYQSIDLSYMTAVDGEDYSVQGQTGYIGALYINGLLKTQASSLANITENTPWFYDDELDQLYVYTDLIDGNDFSVLPDTWENVKKTAREEASQELENYFRSIYTIPFPFKRNSEMEFDEDIKKMVAIMTCMIIIRTDNPENPILDAYHKMLWDTENSKGILEAYLEGRKAFSFEATRATFNGLITPVSVSGTGNIEVLGSNDSLNYDKYEIEITTGGEVGTAKYKLTKNNVDMGTFASYLYYVNLADCNIYIRLSGTFEIGDKWTIEFDGRLKEIKTGIRSLRIVR